MLLKGGTREVLGHQVRRVGGPFDLKEGKRALTKTLLYPQLAYCQVADSPNAAATADADRSSTVSEYLKLKGKVEITAERLKAKALAAAFHQSSKFGFS